MRPSRGLLAVLIVLAGLFPATMAAQPAQEAVARLLSLAVTAPPRVDLNRASVTELTRLPGITSMLARRIVMGRPYIGVGELVRVGVPAPTFDRIRPLVVVGAASEAATGPVMVDLNRASEEELQGLRGIGPETAKNIVAHRPYASPRELSRAGVAGPSSTSSSRSSR